MYKLKECIDERSSEDIEGLDEINLNRAIADPLVCYGGGGKAPSVQTVETPPPPAPPSEEATMEEFTDETLDKSKRKAKTQGAKSLQIPLGTIGDTTTVGTV